MSVALYRKYRSKSLDDIVGQAHVTDVLARALAQDKIAHAYLLTGPRGVGKTSIARILAHEINKLPYTDESEHLDIIEIDAASNNGVDDVRELRDKALIAPSQAVKKIYIIDEVHMLSKPAFNALLKILEEPPSHVVFILATTDLDRLPDTIVSRTQRYHFRAISEDAVVARLADIASAESIDIETPALKIIAQRGEGSMRDSVSLLDQVRHIRSDGQITASDVEISLGLATSNEITTLVDALRERHAAHIIAALKVPQARGVSATTLASQLLQAISAQLAQAPELVHVLSGLMEVAKSHHPETKLLVTLLSDVTVAPKTVAQSVYTEQKPSVVSTPAPRAATATPTAPTPRAAAPDPEPDTAPAPTHDAGPADMSKFDWQAVLEYARQHHTALYAILSKCTPELKDDKLLLYAGRKFNKTKLDSAKYRPLLGQIFHEIGVGSGVDVEVFGVTAPPKDSQAAKIAAMMGGGEEVNVE